MQSLNKARRDTALESRFFDSTDILDLICTTDQPVDPPSDIANLDLWEDDLRQCNFYDMDPEKFAADVGGCGLSLGDDLSHTLFPFTETSKDLTGGDKPNVLQDLTVIPLTNVPVIEAPPPKRKRGRPANQSALNEPTEKRPKIKKESKPKIKKESNPTRVKMYELDTPEAKNAIAARKSREKKQKELEDLVEKNNWLKVEDCRLDDDITASKKKVNNLQVLLTKFRNELAWNMDQRSAAGMVGDTLVSIVQSINMTHNMTTR